MQIEFLEDTPVSPETVPKSAVGRLKVRHSTIPPSFTPQGDAKPAKVGPIEYCFRKGGKVELSEEEARPYIESGVAKVVTAPMTVNWIDPEDIPQ